MSGGNALISKTDVCVADTATSNLHNDFVGLRDQRREIARFERTVWLDKLKTKGVVIDGHGACFPFRSDREREGAAFPEQKDSPRRRKASAGPMY